VVALKTAKARGNPGATATRKPVERNGSRHGRLEFGVPNWFRECLLSELIGLARVIELHSAAQPNARHQPRWYAAIFVIGE
jgi:hypothetical protein